MCQWSLFAKWTFNWCSIILIQYFVPLTVWMPLMIIIEFNSYTYYLKCKIFLCKEFCALCCDIVNNFLTRIKILNWSSFCITVMYSLMPVYCLIWMALVYDLKLFSNLASNAHFNKSLHAWLKLNNNVSIPWVFT